MKKIICYVCAIITAVAIFVGAGFLQWNDIQHERLHENTSTTAVVTDKYTTERKGTFFCVVAEHEAIDNEGNKIIVSRVYSVPWEDFVQIEIGDTIITQYCCS